MKKFFLIITLPLILAATFLPAKSIASTENTSENACNIDVDLQGTLDNNHGKVTNYSKNESCSYEATLAIYDVPLEPGTPRWIDTQSLINSETVTVKPGETIDISVDGEGPSCRTQADLIRGGQEQVSTPPFYANAMDVKVYTTGTCGEIELTPTSIPTSTPVPTCTLTPTPNSPTATPTQSPTNTPAPGQSNSSSSSSSSSSSNSSNNSNNSSGTQTGIVQPALASTGNSAFIFAVVIAGAVSLISGLILKKLSK